MGSKAQRQNQHIKRLERKIRQYKARNEKMGPDGKQLSTEKLEKELGYAKGGARPTDFRTGRDADPRVKKNTGV